MITFRVSPRSQIIVLYLLAGIWNAIWMTGRFFNSYYHVIWPILFVFIPVIFLYVAVRLTFAEAQYLKEHPRAFDGALGLAVLPFSLMILLFFSFR